MYRLFIGGSRHGKYEWCTAKSLVVTRDGESPERYLPEDFTRNTLGGIGLMCHGMVLDGVSGDVEQYLSALAIQKERRA